MTDPAAEPPRHLENRSRAFGIAAFSITWALSAWRVSPSTAWSDDYATIRGLSASAVGPDGLVSAVLCGLFRSVPFGTPIQRLGLVSAFGAAWAAWLAFQLAHRSLYRDPPQAWFRCWLALAASLLVSLGAGTQCAATRPNSSTVAMALGLGCLWLTTDFVADHRLSVLDPSSATSKPRQSFLLGSLVAFACLEHQIVGLFAIMVGVALLALRRSLPLRFTRLWLMLGFGLPFFALGLPWWFARRGLTAAAAEHPYAESVQGLHPFSESGARLGQWVTTLGALWFALAVVGLALLMLRRDRLASAWIAVGVAGAFLLMPVASNEANQRGQAVASIGAVLLAIAAANAIRDIVHWITFRRRSAMALTSTLAAVAQAVTILARFDETAFVLDQQQSLSVEAWTDEALTVLPARAIILARSQPIVERIYAAQLAEGTRPDVLVVPVERTTDPRVVDLLLSAEPNLTSLLRDLAINGRPSENSMSGLADVRPLFVEFDASWDPRLREHLLVMPFFHRVLSQTLGRSDRTSVLADGQRAVSRVLEALGGENPARNLCVSTPCAAGSGDNFTRTVVDRRWREQLTLLLALGDRQAFDAIADDYARVFKGSKWLPLLRQRLSATRRSAVEAFDLLDERNPGLQGSNTPGLARQQG